jgi:hypothetical protein
METTDYTLASPVIDLLINKLSVKERADLLSKVISAMNDSDEIGNAVAAHLSNLKSSRVLEFMIDIEGIRMGCTRVTESSLKSECEKD